MQQQQQMQQQQALVDQAGQLMSNPLMDPSKNPAAAEISEQIAQQQQPPVDG
jgi:hypothetical protein